MSKKDTSELQLSVLEVEAPDRKADPGFLIRPQILRAASDLEFEHLACKLIQLHSSFISLDKKNGAFPQPVVDFFLISSSGWREGY